MHAASAAPYLPHARVERPGVVLLQAGERARAELTGDGIGCRLLPTLHGLHCVGQPHAVEAQLGDLQPQRPSERSPQV